MSNSNNNKHEEYYNTFMELYLTDGWKQLIKELEETQAYLDTIRGVKDPRDLDFRQGQLNVVDTLLNHENQTRQALDALDSTEDGEDAV